LKAEDYQKALQELAKLRLVCPAGKHDWITPNLVYVPKTQTALCRSCSVEAKFAKACDSNHDLHFCLDCKQMKDRDDFHKDKYRICGHVDRCKSCANSKYKERRLRKAADDEKDTQQESCRDL